MPEPTASKTALRHLRYWWHKSVGEWRFRGKPRIAFLHVPKCAGTTLHEAIAAHYPPHLVARIQTSATVQVAEHTGHDLDTVRQQLLWYMARSHDFLFVSGHIKYSADLVADLHPRWSFVTLLREPVERFLSSYFYRLRKSAVHAALDLPLEDYVETRRARRAGATYVRFFAGDGVGEPSDEHVEAALANLQRLQLVGVTEALEEFAESFRRHFGMRLTLGRRNANPASRTLIEQTVTPALRERIRQLCRPDRRIYDHVRRSWGLRPGIDQSGV